MALSEERDEGQPDLAVLAANDLLDVLLDLAEPGGEDLPIARALQLLHRHLQRQAPSYGRAGVAFQWCLHDRRMPRAVNSVTGAAQEGWGEGRPAGGRPARPLFATPGIPAGRPPRKITPL